MDFKSFQQIPKFVPAKEPEQPRQLSNKDFFKGLAKAISPLKSDKEIVAGGDVRWTPVNKQAAMLLARAKEINKPNNNMSEIFSKKEIESARKAEAERKSGHKIEAPRSFTGAGQSFSEKNLSEKEKKEMADAESASAFRKMQKAKENVPLEIAEYTELLLKARASLDMATDLFRADMSEFVLELPEHIRKLRDWRMTMEREKDMALKSLKDLRMFFLEKDHDAEMQRLTEFVRTTERLAALAKDGTLEKVADVMLKLA